MEKLKTTIQNISFRSIHEADINPQQMKEADFKRLVKSIKKDGVLTSSVLVQDMGEGKYKCISGHHRIRAAIRAGLKSCDCIVITDIDESTRIRLQLQHNDIHGEPDEFLVTELKKLLLEADLQLVADGITKTLQDDVIKYDPILYSYVDICMLPESQKEFMQLLDRLSTEESEKIILEKPEYEQLKQCFTLAFKRGFKTPGKAMRQIMDVYLQHEKA